MSSIGIIGLGCVSPTERVERVKKSFLSFLSGSKASDPGVIDLACRAAQRACMQAHLAPEQVELILGASASYTNFTGGSTQLAPRLSWGVHHLLKSFKAYAFDLCSTDGLLGVESAISYVASGKRENVLVVAADQFLEENVVRQSIDHPALLSGAAAAVVGRGPAGFTFVSSAHENADLSEQAIRLDLVYGEGPSERPQGRLVMENQREAAVHLAQCAKKAYFSALDSAGLNNSEVVHLILPRWGKVFADQLRVAFAEYGKTFWSCGESEEVMITAASLSDLFCIAPKVPVKERIAVLGYGFGSSAGCQIFQWQGWEAQA